MKPSMRGKKAIVHLIEVKEKQLRAMLVTATPIKRQVCRDMLERERFRTLATVLPGDGRTMYERLDALLKEFGA